MSRFAPELEIKKIYRSQTGGEERKLWDQEADQAALEKGIRLPDDYPLAKALEDYCS